MMLTPKTLLIELHARGIAKLSVNVSRKLAAAVANYSAKSDPADATVEDLLNYFPMRYEDRSNFIGIDELYDGLEASVEIYTRVSGGFQVGKNRHPRQPQLHIFEITGGDRERTRKPVVVYWFVSGKQSNRIINYYRERFQRGTRFVAFGKWEWDSRRNTFALKLAKPDELEILPLSEPPAIAGGLTQPTDTLSGSDSSLQPPATAGGSDKTSATADGSDKDDDLLEDVDNPEFAMVHSGRCVPVYRKLGQFQTKRLREIIFDVLQKLDRSSIDENLPPEVIEPLVAKLWRRG